MATASHTPTVQEHGFTRAVALQLAIWYFALVGKLASAVEALERRQRRLERKRVRQGHLGAVDRAQMAVVGLLITLLIASIVLLLGPTILALLESSLPQPAANSTFNSTLTDVEGNIDTAFVIGGVLLVIVVVGAMIVVLVNSFQPARGGGRGGFM